MRQQNEAAILAFNEDHRVPKNQTLACITHLNTREMYPHTTVCYCTENERTPTYPVL